MQISKINKNQLDKIGKLSTEYELNILYLADSLGSLDPVNTINTVKHLNHRNP